MADGRRPVIRFRIEPGVVSFDDLVRGHVEIDAAALGGDLVILRADGTPLYHFTVVVDDAAMGITHVIRGEDHLSNTPKHILLFRALGHPEPVFAHLPLILNADRTKMSKRKSQTAVKDYIAEGFIREAFVNYLAFLGWSPGTDEDVLSLEEIVERFDLEAVQKGGAVFDRVRMEWLNGQWIRRLPDADLADRLAPFLEAEWAAGRIDRNPARDEVVAILPLVRERMSVLGAIGDQVRFLFRDAVDLDPALLVPKRWERGTALAGLAAARQRRRSPGRCRLHGRRPGGRAARRSRGERLEGRRPLHGDPGGPHREDGHAAAARVDGHPGARANARAPGPRGARAGGGVAHLTRGRPCDDRAAFVNRPPTRQ